MNEISSRFDLNSPSLEEFLNVCGGVLEAAVGGKDKNPKQNFLLEAGFCQSLAAYMCCHYRIFFSDKKGDMYLGALQSHNRQPLKYYHPLIP
jgi:hypothetical protein